MKAQIGAALSAVLILGTFQPAAAVSNCSQDYDAYMSVPDVYNHEYLETQAKDRYVSCNTENVPAGGTPSNIPITPTTPSIPKTSKCPAIKRDMHGRKDFAGTTCLAGKVLAGFNLSGMDLTGSSLRGSVLTAANLSDAKVAKADFSKAILDYANLSRLDLATVTLSEIRANHVSGTPKSLPAGWKNFGGLLAGPKVDLSNRWLWRVRLTNVDLTGADLTRTKLDDSILTGVNLKNAKFTPSVKGLVTKDLTGKPSTYGVMIVNGYLIAEGVDLTRANLDRAKLAKLSLKNVDLSYASLKDADLTGCDLTGAKLYYANLDRAVLDKAKLGTFSSNTRVQGTPKSLPIGWYVQNGYLKKN